VTDYLGKEVRTWFYDEILSYVDATFGEDEKDAQTYGEIRACLERFKAKKASVKDIETILYQFYNDNVELCCPKCNTPVFE
jgi:hypothetical protein